MENFTKTLLKVYLTLQTFQVCSLITYSSNSRAKNSIDCGMFTIAYATEISHGQKVKILVCLKLEKISPLPKTTNKRFYRCRSIPLLFYIYFICREACFHDDVKSDDEYFMANCSDCGKWYHKKCMNIQVKVF